MSGIQNSSKKAIKKMSENIEEKYLGIENHIESKFSGWCMTEVPDLQNVLANQDAIGQRKRMF